MCSKHTNSNNNNNNNDNHNDNDDDNDDDNDNEHVSNICKKVSTKLHALARISNFMNPQKLRLLMKAFIVSQFSYCPLVWMFHSHLLNNHKQIT